MEKNEVKELKFGGHTLLTTQIAVSISAKGQRRTHDISARFWEIIAIIELQREGKGGVSLEAHPEPSIYRVV